MTIEYYTVDSRDLVPCFSIKPLKHRPAISHNPVTMRFLVLPCVRLVPGLLSAHTSWQAYSSLLLGPGCSRAHRWGAPWWPTRPHLGRGGQREGGGEKRTGRCGKEGKSVTHSGAVSHKTKQNTQRQKKGMLESFLWTLYSCRQYCYCVYVLLFVSTSRNMKLCRNGGKFTTFAVHFTPVFILD